MMKKFIIFALLAVSAGVFAKDKRYCITPPASNVLLKGADMYDGPPSEKYIRIPSDSKTTGPVTWDMFNEFAWAQEKGEGAYLACDFGGGTIVPEKVNQSAKKCVVKYIKKSGAVIATCDK